MTTPLALPALRRYLRHGTLPQLAAFEAVVRLGSATRAAHALCVAQPTISGHLRKLADALGVRLFERRGKRLVPTAAGIALLEATDEVSAVLARAAPTLASETIVAPQPVSSTSRPSRTAGSSSTITISRPSSVMPIGPLAGIERTVVRGPVPRGSSTVKTEPRPSCELRSSGTAISAQRRLTIARPRPRPFFCSTLTAATPGTW